MIAIKDINFEYRYSAIFGAIALSLSLITGIISGITIITVIIRAIVIAIVFFGLGYGSLFVIKKYVPEIFDVKENSDDLDIDSEAETDQGDKNEQESNDTFQEVTSEVTGSTAEKPEFQEISPESLPKVETAMDNGLKDNLDQAGNGSLPVTGSGPDNAGQSLSDKSMGKHIIAKDGEFSQYEPKIMAQAVRTMMSKDED